MEKLDSLIEFDKEEHRYYIEGIEIPSVSHILKTAGYISGFKIDPIYANRGSFIHLLSEMIDENQAIDYEICPAEWLPFLTAYEWFKNDEDYEIVKSEYIIFHPHLLYAGTADREYEGGIQGDIKTGYYQGWHELQLAAYMMASGCSKGFDLYLSKDGAYKIRHIKNASFAIDAFKSATYAYWFNRRRDYKKLQSIVSDFKGEGK